MPLIICSLPPGTERREFDLFPGSDEAINLGCNCPHQSWWPAEVRLSKDCPVHELKRVTN